jgi:hypothetical protein
MRLTGQVRLRYAFGQADLQPDGTARSTTVVHFPPGDGGPWMDRPHENQCARAARRHAGQGRHPPLPLRGEDAEMTVVNAGSGGFSLPGSGTNGTSGRSEPMWGCSAPAR